MRAKPKPHHGGGQGDQQTFMDQVFRRQQMAVPRGGGQYLWRRAPWWWWWWWWKILNDGALHDGALHDGVLHDGGKKKEVNKNEKRTFINVLSSWCICVGDLVHRETAVAENVPRLRPTNAVVVHEAGRTRCCWREQSEQRQIQVLLV